MGDAALGFVETGEVRVREDGWLGAESREFKQCE